MGGAFLVYLGSLMLGMALSKRRVLAFVIATLGYVLAISDFMTKQLMESHISYFILSRLDMTMLEMAPVVIPVLFYGGIVCTVLLLYGQYRLIRRLHQRPLKMRTSMVLGVLAMVLISQSTTTKALIDTCTTAQKVHSAADLSFDEIKHRLGMVGYASGEGIDALAGKNLVVVYLESLENNFLDENRFPIELRNLHSLQSEGWHTYDNYICMYGSDCTNGALYATQTGLPMMFGGGRGIFVQADTEAVSYTKVLGQAGYENLFLSNCNLEFASAGAMMRALGYQTFGGEDFDPAVLRTRWGAHDAQVFAKAKEEYLRLAASDRPFQLTILTVDTHYPNGFPDPSMREYVDARIPTDSHEYVVATLDYLVGDFVRFIESQPGGKDTVIVLLNDHPMMHKKDRASIVDKLKDRPRHNLLLTNRPIEGFAQTDEIAFRDIPKIMLSLAEVRHNARFPVDCIPNMTEQYIKDNEVLLTLLNIKLTE